jgi:hypothetical protein
VPTKDVESATRKIDSLPRNIFIGPGILSVEMRGVRRRPAAEEVTPFSPRGTAAQPPVDLGSARQDAVSVGTIIRVRSWPLIGHRPDAVGGTT